MAEKTKRRWVKWILVPAGIVVTLGGLCYFILVYRFREVLNLLVLTESAGRYRADAKGIRVAFWNKKITINDLAVYAVDTTANHSHYTVRVKKVFLSVQSVRELLFNKKLLVKDIEIQAPEVSVHVHSREESDESMSYRASDVIDVLNNISAHLQVKTLALANASFIYSSYKYPDPFRVDKININISNFRKKDRPEHDLMYTDDIDLIIGDQSWTLPNGKQDIAFRKLHFSARNQFIQIDTCTFVLRGVPGADTISLYADQLRFSPRQLQAHLKKDELVIDSLLLKQPLLVFHKGTRKIKDTTRSISGALNQLFSRVNLGYVDINEGAFQVYELNNPAPAYTTQRVNMELFNLDALSARSNALSFDSIRLKLNELKFITKDSLYQLTVREFNIKNNDLIFLDARFGNTASNPSPSSMTFSTPTLRFRDIDLEALLNKQLRAPSIEIINPEIKLFASGRGKAAEDTAAKFSPQDFYKVMNGLDELINVDSFHVRNGRLNLRSPLNRVRADAAGINGVVLVNQLLKSDELGDIKRAIPVLKVANASFSKTGTDITASGFTFFGDSRLSLVSTLSVGFLNGSRVDAADIAWDLSDWDVYQLSKSVKISRLSIGELNADIKNTKGNPKNDLPRIDINNIAIARANFLFASGNQKLGAGGSNLYLENLKTNRNHFEWDSLQGEIQNLSYTTPLMSATLSSMQINSDGTGTISDLTINGDRSYSFSSPIVRLNAVIHSTDLSTLHIGSVKTDTANIFINRKSETQIAATNKTRMGFNRKKNFRLDSLALSNTSLRYTDTAGDATFSAVADITGSDLIMSNDSPATTGSGNFDLELRNGRAELPELKFSMPVLSLQLHDGRWTASQDNWLLQTDLQGSWKNLSLEQAGTNSLFTLDSVSGSLGQKGFKMGPDHFPDWYGLTRLIQVTEGNAKYTDDHLVASARAIRWNSVEEVFETGAFSVAPLLNAEKMFDSAKWQKEHVAATGKSARFSGLKLPKKISLNPSMGSDPDSMLLVNKVLLDGVSLVTYRDKQMPFRHGIEKLMPTELLKNFRMPVRLDTLLLTNSDVTISEKTAKEGKITSVPLTQINASVVNITNRPEFNELLEATITGSLVTNRIDRIHYTENYGDSLSPFEMRVHVAPMTLTTFTGLTKPLASVRVASGTSDTLHAFWSGNKYAAAGTMNFHYDGLKIEVLQGSSTRNKLSIKLRTWIGNLLIRNKNQRETAVFFVRDREKFVFNYWLKTSLSGLMTSVGIRRSKMYYLRYNKLREAFSLPEFPATTKPAVDKAPLVSQ